MFYVHFMINYREDEGKKKFRSMNAYEFFFLCTNKYLCIAYIFNYGLFLMCGWVNNKRSTFYKQSTSHNFSYKTNK